MTGELKFQDYVGRKAESKITLFAPGDDPAFVAIRLAAFGVVVQHFLNTAVSQTAVAKRTVTTLAKNPAKPRIAPLAIITDRAICTFSYVGGDHMKVLSLQIPAPDLSKTEQSAHIGRVITPANMQILADGLNALNGRTDIVPIRGVIRTTAQKGKG